ncbi:MAG: RluA family pseudouridine synthase [Synergistaceae bacterium]|jgi:23S rRNA pseudouridine1911/1915/1917 synthase|nr:RluA family pseudouridine synthase [Synergistaceae bacterium]
MYTRRMTITEELSGHRLDFSVSRELGVGRTYAQTLIRDGRVLSSGDRRIKPSIKVGLGEEYSIEIPPPERLDLEPEDVAFRVVYSDDDVIVVDKPAGLVVHPAPGHWSGTLVHGLLFRFPELGSLNGVERPGIVHRLDATTSGLMVVARNGLAQESLFKEFKERRVSKTYLALCHSVPERAAGRIDMPVGRDPVNRHRMAVTNRGRAAVTDYTVIWSDGGYSFVRCAPRSGRTHQIRVHMKALNCPLVGDELYAPSRRSPFLSPRVFLHSWKISFTHPRHGGPMDFRSFIPDDLIECLRAIRVPSAIPPDRPELSSAPCR